MSNITTSGFFSALHLVIYRLPGFVVLRKSSGRRHGLTPANNREFLGYGALPPSTKKHLQTLCLTIWIQSIGELSRYHKTDCCRWLHPYRVALAWWCHYGPKCYMDTGFRPPIQCFTALFSRCARDFPEVNRGRSLEAQGAFSRNTFQILVLGNGREGKIGLVRIKNALMKPISVFLT